MARGRGGNHLERSAWGLLLLALGMGACANLIGADEWTFRDDEAASSSASSASSGGGGGAGGQGGSSVGGAGGAGGAVGAGGSMSSSSSAGGAGGGPAPTCSDNVKNGAETAIDCGGGVCPDCGLCAGCIVDTDCLSLCCVNGICALKDAGGCDKVTTCPNGCQDGMETDFDCGGGGACSWTCGYMQKCLVDADCEAGLFCDSMTKKCLVLP